MRCNNLINTSSVTFCNENIILTVDDFDLENGTHKCIYIAQDIPTYTGTPNIVICINRVLYEIIQCSTQCLCGTPNKLYIDQLIKNESGETINNQILSVRFASDTNLFKLCARRCIIKSDSGYSAESNGGV